MTFRDRFPIFKTKTYLNSCSQGALSVDVQRAYQDYLCDWDEKGSPWELWVERSETARQAFAGLINADPNEVADCTSVSAGVSALASALDFNGSRQLHRVITAQRMRPRQLHCGVQQSRRNLNRGMPISKLTLETTERFVYSSVA